MTTVLLLSLIWVMLLLGLLGTVLPAVPGVVLVFAGILLYVFSFGVESIGLTTLVFMGIATLCSLGFDTLASMYGTARFGGSRFGILGSITGGILGLTLLSLPGLFIGLFAGALVAERVFGKRTFIDATRIGLGSVLGFLAGSLFSFLVALAMIGVFAFRVWF